jgi:hypothetical protein
MLLKQFRHRPVAASISVALVLIGIAGLLWAILHPAPRTVVVVPDRSREDLARFLDNLATVKSEAQLRALTDRDFATLFALPPPGPTAASAWARTLHPILDAVRQGRETVRALLKPAAASAPLVDSGENGPFRAVEQIAVDGMTRLLREEVEAAQDEPRAKVEQRKATVGTLLEAWKSFVASLPAGFLARHPFVTDHARTLEDLGQGFPSDLTELGEIRLEDCLAAPNPEAELARAEEKLRVLIQRPKVSLESRRDLWTTLVSASALRSLFAGRSEEETAQALQSEGDALRRTGATAVKTYGGRVQAVLERLLR